MDLKEITGHEPINPLYSFGNIPQNKADRELVEGGTLYSGLTILQEFTRSAMMAYATADPDRRHANIAEEAVRLAKATIKALNEPAP